MDEDWRKRAFCATHGIDPEVWVGEDPTLYVLAMHYCKRHCPVLDECREDAFTYAYRGVVAGGIVWSLDHPGARRRYEPRHVLRCGICREAKGERSGSVSDHLPPGSELVPVGR